MGKPMTPDEIVAELKHRHEPTILVEGDDDIMIYRWMSERIGIFNVKPLACGGRSSLLAVYERRAEFSHLNTAFVADRDMWLFSAIPPEYSEVVWTEGYSIENDLYAGLNLEDLLNRDEASEHRQVLNCLIEWFAFEVEEFRRGNEAQTAIHPNEIVPLGTVSISPQFAVRRGYRQPTHAAVVEIESVYKLKLRGKTLFELLVRYLSETNRDVKHSIKGLYEIAFKIPQSDMYMERLIEDIQAALSV